MSPQQFCLWVADHPRVWWFVFRGKLRPDQPVPWSVVPVATVVAAVLAGGPVLTAALLVTRSSDVNPLGAFRAVIEPAVELGAIAGFWLAMFGRLVWNQRSARINAGAPSGTMPPRWPALLFLGPVHAIALALVLPGMLFTGIENIRGALRWNSVRNGLVAAGEKLRVEEFVPTAVAPADNFAAIPQVEGMFSYQRLPGVPLVWKNTNAVNALKVFALPDAYLPNQGSKGHVTPQATLDDWAAAFRACKSARDAGKWKAIQLPEYGVAPDGASPAEVVLVALGIADADLAQLKAASSRPLAVFPIHWDEGFEALLPHLARLKQVNAFLNLRVWAELERGDSAAAFDDALAAARIADVLRDEPLLISQLVRIAQSAIASRTINRGIERHAWDEAQLAALQQAVERWKPAAGVFVAIRGERAAASIVFDRWVSSRRRFAEEIHDVGNGEGSENRSVDWMAYLMPSGWIRNAQANLSLFEQSVIDTLKPSADGIPEDGFEPIHDQLERLEDGIPNDPRFRQPGGILARTLAPAFSRAIAKGFRAEQNARSTAVACALERYRLAKGSYPESLAALVPTYLAKEPVDVMDGKPQRYSRTAAGGFRLWGIGLDGVDHKGLRKSPKTHEPLDWAWP